MGARGIRLEHVVEPQSLEEATYCVGVGEAGQIHGDPLRGFGAVVDDPEPGLLGKALQHLHQGRALDPDRQQTVAASPHLHRAHPGGPRIRHRGQQQHQRQPTPEGSERAAVRCGRGSHHPRTL